MCADFGINHITGGKINTIKRDLKDLHKQINENPEEKCRFDNPDILPNISYVGRDIVHKAKIITASIASSMPAYNAETKSGKASFTLARGDERFPNIWDENGGYYTPKKGDIIMGYGSAQEDWGIKHPDVLKEMHAFGLTTYPDRAVSSEPELMYETYVGADGRDFQKEPLQYGETVDSVKKIFPARFLFMPEGTLVETLEAREGAQKMPKVGAFQYIQIDAKGNPYVKDIKDLLKRLRPTDEESEKIFAKVKELDNKRKEILGRTDIDDVQKEESLSLLWSFALLKLMKY